MATLIAMAPSATGRVGNPPVSNALASKQGALAPLKDADVGDVLTRVLNEESTKDIAKSFGVTRSALNQWLLAYAEKDWKTVQVIRAHKRKDEAEEEIETATDALSLARAREKLRAAQWDLERVCRRIYGQDAPASAQAVQINISLRGDSATKGVVIDGDSK
jgi:transposase